ncbi:MAG TPA: hypothetical protein VMF69_05270 [Gemmataceae bacterium]|nr:hypothetical protein [Gemmataceae bacterium]
MDPIRGRGASGNPANRFELIQYERDESVSEDEAPATGILSRRRHSGLVDAYLV